MIGGSCLCGAVRWEVDGRLEGMGNCHCSMCRKAHGAAFATYARVAASAFRIASGEEHVRQYASSPEVVRTFCGGCGSNLLFLDARMPEKVWVAAGTCDDDPGVRPALHIFVASKAPWYEIADGLPQRPESAGFPRSRPEAAQATAAARPRGSSDT
jgi:hypothetical protein